MKIPYDTGCYEPDVAGEQRIEITKEMIEAGVSCLEESGYLYGDRRSSGLNLLVREVFEKMLRCCRSSTR